MTTIKQAELQVGDLLDGTHVLPGSDVGTLRVLDATPTSIVAAHEEVNGQTHDDTATAYANTIYQNDDLDPAYTWVLIERPSYPTAVE